MNALIGAVEALPPVSHAHSRVSTQLRRRRCRLQAPFTRTCVTYVNLSQNRATTAAPPPTMTGSSTQWLQACLRPRGKHGRQAQAPLTGSDSTAWPDPAGSPPSALPPSCPAPPTRAAAPGGCSCLALREKEASDRPGLAKRRPDRWRRAPWRAENPSSMYSFSTNMRD
jgi:hypothetical protein